MFKKITILFLLIIFLGNIFFPHFSFAQYGLEEGQKIQGLSTSQPEIFVGRIIKAVLLIIGVILIVLIIYGGIMYTTAMGNEQKLETAKKILVYAVIGVIIIALAYAITIFVLNSLFPKEQQQQQLPEEQQLAGTCTCVNGEKVSVNKGTECDIVCKNKGGPEGFLDKYGYEYTYKPPTPEQTCIAENNKQKDCRIKPSIKIEDKAIKGTGFKAVEDCCSGLDCDEETGLCFQKCANNGEYYKTLIRGQVLTCCSQDLWQNPNTGKCERTRL